MPKLPSGSVARVWRPNVGKWEGTFKLLYISDETSTFLVRTALRGYSEFRTTVFKPYLSSVPATAPSPAPSDAPSTKEARTKELEILFANGVFGVVHVRNVGTPDEYTMSQLVVQAIKDMKHALITLSPTLSYKTLRLSPAPSIRMVLKRMHSLTFVSERAGGKFAPGLPPFSRGYEFSQYARIARTNSFVWTSRSRCSLV